LQTSWIKRQQRHGGTFSKSPRQAQTADSRPMNAQRAIPVKNPGKLTARSALLSRIENLPPEIKPSGSPFHSAN
jgi:hypothetical protein